MYASPSRGLQRGSTTQRSDTWRRQPSEVTHIHPCRHRKLSTSKFSAALATEPTFPADLGDVKMTRTFLNAEQLCKVAPVSCGVCDICCSQSHLQCSASAATDHCVRKFLSNRWFQLKAPASGLRAIQGNHPGLISQGYQLLVGSCMRARSG